MNIFNKTQFNRPKANKFDLGHERKFSMNMGDIVPIFVKETLPGDNDRVNSAVLMRLAPMLAPMMHRVNIRVDYFDVPIRLIYNEWEAAIGGGPQGTSAPVFPYIEVATAMFAAGFFKEGSLADYIGLPTADTTTVVTPDGTLRFSPLPFLAYQLIYNEYYRDPTLTPPVPLLFGSGNHSAEYADLLQLRKSSWEKDYFTSALPFAQRGGAVNLPIEGTSSDITYFPQSKVTDTSGAPIGNNDHLGTGNLDPDLWAGNPVPASGQQARIENIQSFAFDAADVTINVLYRAIALQTWLERNARGGYRYIEQNLAHWGVISDDARLQRPEYLGGSRKPIVISEVLSTFEDDAGSIPQGNMSGHGVAHGGIPGYRKRFKEHSITLGLLRVLPKTAYQNGVPRWLQRFDRFDYAFPELAHIGEQPVMNNELFFDYESSGGGSGIEGGVFGYQSRYCEYKYLPSTVHGDFKSSLAYWHMGRIFASSPDLNAAFVEADPTHRIFNVVDPDVHKLYVQIVNQVDSLRLLPYFGTPHI